MADPGEPVAVRAKADGVDPTAAVKAVDGKESRLLLVLIPRWKKHGHPDSLIAKDSIKQ